MNLVLCRTCSGEYPATSLEGGLCHACAVAKREEMRALMQRLGAVAVDGPRIKHWRSW